MIYRVGQLGYDDARVGCGTGDMYSGPHMVARKEAEVGLFQMLLGFHLWKLQPPQPGEPQLTFMCRLRAGKINSLSILGSGDLFIVCFDGL